jgi:diguanylate cyclase (GGDEF)-like protein
VLGLILRSRQFLKGWALWQAPKRVVIFVMAVIAVAMIASAATALLIPIGMQDWARFGVLAVCAWVAIELTRHIERKREYWRRNTVAYIDTKAVWSFAAVIVLPPLFASAMVVLTYFLAWSRIRPHSRPGMMFRWVFSCATVLIGTQAAVLVLYTGMQTYPGAPSATTLAGLSDLGIVVLAAIFRWGLNVALVMAAIALSDPTTRIRDLFNNFSEQLLEAGAMGLGMVAAAVVVTSPFVLPGIVIAMVALHRGLLVHQYEQASRTDNKTGLASASWWHDFAEQALVRTRDSGTSMGVLIIDLDHFKNVNDTYGHPFGDEVLQAVATEILAEVRDKDACGRWGGEEFTIALPEVGNSQNLYHVAERIRRRIQSIVMQPPGRGTGAETVNLSASVGAALYPAEGISTLDELVLAADTALYAAKNSGRNAVRLSVALPTTPPAEHTPPALKDKTQGPSPTSP